MYSVERKYVERVPKYVLLNYGLHSAAPAYSYSSSRKSSSLSTESENLAFKSSRTWLCKLCVRM